MAVEFGAITHYKPPIFANLIFAAWGPTPAANSFLVSALHVVADGMGKRELGGFAREIGHLSRPIAEARSETVRGYDAQPQALEQRDQYVTG